MVVATKTENAMKMLRELLRAIRGIFGPAHPPPPAVPVRKAREKGKSAWVPQLAGEAYFDDAIAKWEKIVEANYAHSLYPGIAVAAKDPAMRREVVRALALTHAEYPLVWFAIPAIAKWVREGATAEEVVMRRRIKHEAKAERKAARAARKAATTA